MTATLDQITPQPETLQAAIDRLGLSVTFKQTDGPIPAQWSQHHKRYFATVKRDGYKAQFTTDYYTARQPEAIDCLWCLASDATVLDYASFESWAHEHGFDVDSRQAESTYKACLKNAKQLRVMLGKDGLQALRDACQDY